MRKRVIRFILGVLFLIAGIYFFGPREKFRTIDPVIKPADIEIGEVDQYVKNKDIGIPNLKENNQGRVIWADSTMKTRYALVYLHGFSASPMEGNPVHYQIARKYGMNMYIPRMAGHGLDDKDSFADLEPADLINSAKEAIAIGRLLGEKVIVMSCSTGSTYSIYLASLNPGWIDAMIMYSPNIEIYDKTSRLLTGPWGLQMGRYFLGKYYETRTDFPQFTTETYRTEGLIALQKLLDESMSESIFKGVQCPYFAGFYFRNEDEQDKVVSTDAIRSFHEVTSTPEDQKVLVPFPDVGNHVIPSGLHSKDIESVIMETSTFLEKIMSLEPIKPIDLEYTDSTY